MAKRLELGNTAKLLENTVENINNMESRDNFKLREIPIEQIEFNEQNFYEVKEFEKLKADIADNGLYHNLMVQKIGENKYKLLSGERRLRAVTELGWQKAPCKIVENLSDIDAQIMLIRANDTSREINTEEKMEQIKRIEELYEAKKRAGQKLEGTKRDEVSKLAGISGRQYDRLKSLDKLIPEILNMVKDGLLGESSAIQFANMDKETQKSVYRTLMEQGGKVNREQAIEIKKNYDDELSRKNKEIEKLKKENKQLSDSNLKLQGDNEQVQNDIKKALNETSSLKSEMNKKEGEIQTALSDLQAERKKSNPNKKHMEDLENNLKTLNAEKDNINGKISDYENEIEKLIKEKAEIQEKLLNAGKEKADNPSPTIEKNIEISLKLKSVESQLSSIFSDVFGLRNDMGGFLTDRNKQHIERIVKFLNEEYALAIEE